MWLQKKLFVEKAGERNMEVRNIESVVKRDGERGKRTNE